MRLRSVIRRNSIDEKMEMLGADWLYLHLGKCPLGCRDRPPIFRPVFVVSVRSFFSL